MEQTTTFTTYQHPPPPPLRQIVIPAGTLVGYKACPGDNGQRLLDHASSDPGSSLWSGIYVQLSLAQAVSYVPNQYDRGETTCCICKVVATKPLKVAVLDDPLMADVGISSDDKAGRVLASIEQTPFLEWKRGDYHPSVVGFFATQDHALCLVDCENYELAVPHDLFSADRLAVEPILRFPVSTVIPGGVIGKMEVLLLHNQVEDGGSRTDCDRLFRMSRSELADASCLGQILEERFDEHKLLTTVRVNWLPPPNA